MSQPFTPPPPPSNAPVTVPNNLVLAIVASALSLILCCLPHGVVSLIFALQVDKKAQAGDLQGATNAARQAKLWAWISLIVSGIWLIISIVFGVFAGVMSAISR
jgi:hypothetical protein